MLGSAQRSRAVLVSQSRNQHNLVLAEDAVGVQTTKLLPRPFLSVQQMSPKLRQPIPKHRTPLSIRHPKATTADRAAPVRTGVRRGRIGPQGGVPVPRPPFSGP